MKKNLILISMAILLGTAASSRFSEKTYQNQWCAQAGGETEVVLPDRTRCDCVTSTHAIEFDFGKKWAEAIGQALYYSLQTEKRAGIVLILESPKDRKFWIRLNSTILYHNLPIDTWEITPAQINKQVEKPKI